jgi:uncharacterized protein YgbK (DUF1537 family)
VRAPGEALPARGIVVGEAMREGDLDVWAAHGAQRGVLAAGASEFFGAYLRALGHAAVGRALKGSPGGAGRALFVCGSTSATSRAFCRQSEARGVPVCRLPMPLLDKPGPGLDAGALVERWEDEIASALSSHARAVAAIDRPLCPGPGMPQVLGEYLGRAVECVLRRVAVACVCVEGGATAASLLRRMGWARLCVCREWATGVTTCRVEDQAAPLVTIKPGSYAWPEALLG